MQKIVKMIFFFVGEFWQIILQIQICRNIFVFSSNLTFYANNCNIEVKGIMIYLSSTMKLHKSHIFSFFFFCRGFVSLLLSFFLKKIWGCLKSPKLISTLTRIQNRLRCVQKWKFFSLTKSKDYKQSHKNVKYQDIRKQRLQFAKKDIFKVRFFFFSADILNSFDVYKRQSFESDKYQNPRGK